MSELEKTISLLEGMGDHELREVQSFAKILLFKKPEQDAPFESLSEEEFFAEVDKGLREADAGELEDTSMMLARIAEKYGLVV